MKNKNIIKRILREQLNPIKWVKPHFEDEEDEFMNHFLNWYEDNIIKVNFDLISDEEYLQNRESWKLEQCENNSSRDVNIKVVDSWNVNVEWDDKSKTKEELTIVIYEKVKLEQNYRDFDFESPWEGTNYIKELNKKIDDKKSSGSFCP